MLKLVGVAGAAALFGAASVPVVAQAPTANPTAAAPTTKAEADYLNEVVCQKQEVTGSRLAKRRVCKTRAQWADQQLQDRQEIERAQTQRGLKGD